MLWDHRAFSTVVPNFPLRSVWLSLCFPFSVFYFQFSVVCFLFSVFSFLFSVHFRSVWLSLSVGFFRRRRPAKFCERQETLFLAARKHQLIVRPSEKSVCFQIVKSLFKEPSLMHDEESPSGQHGPMLVGQTLDYFLAAGKSPMVKLLEISLQ